MKNRIYISLPISGRDMEDVESAIKSAAAQIEKHGFKAVSPLEVSPDPESSYAVHIGRGITALLECDAVPCPARMGGIQRMRTRNGSRTYLRQEDTYELWNVGLLRKGGGK